MPFSEIGLIWAYTILASLSLNYAIGILFLYKSKKNNARLLGYFSLRRKYEKSGIMLNKPISKKILYS